MGSGKSVGLFPSPPEVELVTPQDICTAFIWENAVKYQLFANISTTVRKIDFHAPDDKYGNWHGRSIGHFNFNLFLTVLLIYSDFCSSNVCWQESQERREIIEKFQNIYL